MKEKSEIHIRMARPADMAELRRFFVKAYGEKTIFQSEQFLTHYFDSARSQKPLFGHSIIGLNSAGEIVSHYGGLQCGLKMGGRVESITWGVNAYTLPEYRGRGVNSQMVDHIAAHCDIHGVIGFTASTSLFYQALGYRLFDFQRFSRHVHILDYDKTVEVCRYIGQGVEKLSNHERSAEVDTSTTQLREVVTLTADSIKDYHLHLDDGLPELATTARTKEFLGWRFFDNPFIDYAVYGLVREGAIVAYVTLREEVLDPLGYRVCRLIDLFGQAEAVTILLQKAIHESITREYIYLDFSKFGSLYDVELSEQGFIHLEEEDCCVLPQVTSPMADRPNGEYLGLFSAPFSGELKALTRENVYFTRMDSDRDRLANINQIKHARHGEE